MAGYPKSLRLRSKGDFQTMYHKSFRIFGDFFILRLRPGGTLPRLGVTVSKKFGGSPYRNGIRRLIKELFRHNLPALAVDAHFSQSKPIFKMPWAKRELHRFFALLGDRAFLKAHASRGDTLALKSYLPSGPMGLPARAAFEAVLLYKRFASPGLRPACRFTPTCSEYALDALRIHGFAKGLALAAARLSRCNPLGPSGYDPVPKKKSPPGG